MGRQLLAAALAWTPIRHREQSQCVDLLLDRRMRLGRGERRRQPRDYRHAAATPTPNGAFVSNDTGHTWTATSLFRTQRFFRTIRFATNDPQIVYATANWFSPTSAWVYSSSNGGVTWAEHDWTFTGADTVLQSNIDVAAISPTNARVVYVRTDGTDDVLLRSTDGGTTFADRAHGGTRPAAPEISASEAGRRLTHGPR